MTYRTLGWLIIFLTLTQAQAQAQRTYLTREDMQNWQAEKNAVDADMKAKWKDKATMIKKERKTTLDELYAAMYQAIDAAERPQHRTIYEKYMKEIKAAKEYYAEWERTARKDLIKAAKKEKLEIQYRYRPETRPQTEVVEVMP